MSDVTAEDLRALLDYDPETGVFRWLWRADVSRSTNVRLSGRVAGCPDHYGYIVIRIRGRLYKAHRLAWLYMTGEWPSHQIDHRLSETGDNRWEKLRQATHQQNMFNSKMPKSNTSGFKGVIWDKRRGMWRAQIGLNYRCIVLGLFTDPSEAYSAYLKAASELHGEFARAA